MRKGIRKINLLSSIFFVLLLVLVMFSRVATSQINPQEQSLEKENPIPIYFADEVFSVDDLLLVDAGLGLEFFNNTNKEDPQYLGEYDFDYNINKYVNLDDQLFCVGFKYNEMTEEYYKYFAHYSIKESASLELVKDFNLPYTIYENIILENDTSLVLTVNNTDRQSFSLFNCTETLEEILFQYTHESFFNSNDMINGAIYEDGYLYLKTYNDGGANRTLSIFDITNRTKPELLLSWSSGSSLTHNYDITIENDLMYLISRNGYAKVLSIAENRTLEEIGELEIGYAFRKMKIVDNYAFISTGSNLTIFNITDWENIVKLGTYVRGENLGTLDVFFVIDDLIYVSHYTTRTDNLLILLDWSDPANPVFIRTFGFPHTDPVPFFTLVVPVVFLVFSLGVSKRRIRKKDNHDQ
jgi:hypothetical protein